MSAVIGATHVLCAIGRGTDQVWASARAGVARIGNSHVMDRHFEPIQMGLVPEDGLGALTPEIEELPLPSRARRMLRLAAPSFEAVAKDVGRPVPVFIGLPALTPKEAPWIVHVPAYLQKLTNVPVDLQRSAIVPHGRAAGLMALELAMNAIAADATATVIVGGVDSYPRSSASGHARPGATDSRAAGNGRVHPRRRRCILRVVGKQCPESERATGGRERCRLVDGRRPSLWDRARQR